MKLRYTSLQADTGAGEEQHPELPQHLDGTPVVVAGLHSQVPAIVAAATEVAPDARIAYVMTDGAALPIAFSDLVHRLRGLGWLAGTVTAGHAFGGDVEAVGVPSALALARHALGADIVVVAIGPGVVGTGTRLGTTALDVAPALDAAAWLGGDPIACVRISDADPRPRHRGVSHHTRTALEAVRSDVTVPLPPGYDLPDLGRHHVLGVDPPDVPARLATVGLRVTTMGRGPEDEPGFFAACGAAGVVAAERAVRRGLHRRP